MVEYGGYYIQFAQGALNMKKWQGSAGICINQNAEILMVLQGTPEEEKKWSIPSGGLDSGESFAECCKRELEEETGYQVEIIEEIKVKKEILAEDAIEIEVHYFLVKLVGGEQKIQDPDGLIYDIAWKAVDDLSMLDLSFPEDREFLISFIKENRAVYR
jgi:ADP-ribose pyrophosphatase YjhB (NUDIX family)